MNIRMSKLILMGIGAAIAAMSSPVIAQTQTSEPKVISPLRVENDPNGVNIITGKMKIPNPTLSVPAAPNLKYDGVQSVTPYLLNETTGGAVGGESGYAISSVSIHAGQGLSSSFRCVDFSDCQNKSGNGSKLEIPANLFMQAGTGAVYNFNLKHVESLTANKTTSQYYASSISYPNGEVISFTYDTYSATISGIPRTYYRPNKVSSNLGYYLTISYQSATFPTGWNLPQQVKLFSTADPSTPLGQLTYSGSQITDISGRIFECSGCAYAVGGSEIEKTSGSFKLPGETAQQLTVTQHPTAQVISSVVKDGVTWTYSYSNLRLDGNAANWLYDSVTVSGPNGYQDIYTVAQASTGAGYERNHIAGNTDELGRTTLLSSDSQGRPIKVTSPEGNLKQVVYDAFANITSSTAKAKIGSGLADIVETAYVDTVGCNDSVLCYRPTWVRDGLSRQTDFVYNGRGQMIEQTDPANGLAVRRKTYITYDATSGISRPTVVRTCGQGTTCGTTAESRTEYTYWGKTFLPATETRVDAATSTSITTSYTYDLAGRLLVADGPLAGTDDAVYNRYDVLGRKTWEIGALGANGVRLAKRFTYRDSDDKIIKTESGTVPNATATTLTVLEEETVEYDARRNPVRKTRLVSGTQYNVVDTAYNDRGQLICTTVRMNPVAYGATPLPACTAGTAGTDGADRITKNSYDVAGQLLKVTEAVGQPEESDEVTYTYTLNGQKKTVTDANGNKAEYSYDGYDRLVKWAFPSKTTAGAVSTTDYEQYGYDVVGNRTSLRKRDGRVFTFTYDGMNRMMSKIVPDGCAPIQVGPCPTAAATRDVFYNYDIDGMQLYARFDSAAGEGIAYEYDGFDRLKTTYQTMDGVTRPLLYQWDASGNRTKVTHPDSKSFTSVYDAAKRTTLIKDPANAALRGFTYNNRGLVSALAHKTGTAGSTSISYDVLGRPITLGHNITGTANDISFGFTYNPASQVATRTTSNDGYAFNGLYNVDRLYAVNGLNQYSTAGSAAFTYDANGNLTGDGANTYSYDAENRLIAASGATSAILRYDPLGRLYETSGGSAGITRFLYDGDELVGEYNASGTMLRRYAHGAGVDDPIVWYEGAATTQPRFVHADYQGSIITVTDSAGTALGINRYDEYGIPASTNLGRFQYTGQAWLPELGLYYYKARLYSPTLGRFLQTDPIGYDDQFNLYAYVGGDPVNGRDPAGKKSSRVEPNTCSRVGGSSCSGSYSVGGKAVPVAAHSRNVNSGPTSGSGKENSTNDSAEIESNNRDSYSIGRAGEAEIKQSLEISGNTIIGEQVRIQTKIGLRIIDFVTRDKNGNIYGLEVKTNSGRYNDLQKNKDRIIRTEGGKLLGGDLSPSISKHIGRTIAMSTLVVYVYK